MNWIKMKILPVAPVFLTPYESGGVLLTWQQEKGAKSAKCGPSKPVKPAAVSWSGVNRLNLQKGSKCGSLQFSEILSTYSNVHVQMISGHEKNSEDFPPTSPTLKFWLALSSQTCPFRGTRCNPLRWASICTRARRPWCTSPVGGLYWMGRFSTPLFIYLLSPQSPMDSTSRIPIPIRTPIVLINQQSSGDNHRYWGWNEVYSIINE